MLAVSTISMSLQERQATSFWREALRAKRKSWDMPARMAPTTGPNQYTCRRGVGEWGRGGVSVFVDGDRFGIQAVSPSGSPRNQQRWPDPENAPGSCFRRRTEPGADTHIRPFSFILNITKRVQRFGSAHPQQHSGGVGEPDGQVSWFRVLPPSLLLHGEDGEHHLEGAQHLNGQSLSRIQLQGHLWGRGVEGALRGRGGWKQCTGFRVSGLRTDLVDEVFGCGLERQGQIEGPGPQAGPQALGSDIKESPEEVQPPGGQESQREGRVHLAGSTKGPRKARLYKTRNADRAFACSSPALRSFLRSSEPVPRWPRPPLPPGTRVLRGPLRARAQKRPESHSPAPKYPAALRRWLARTAECESEDRGGWTAFRARTEDRTGQTGWTQGK